MSGVKGRSGGKREGAGRPVGSPNKPKLWGDAIRRAVLRQAKGEKTKRLEVLADSLVRAGMAGDVSALREVGDRLDGKPAQAIEHSGSMVMQHEDALEQLERARDKAS